MCSLCYSANRKQKNSKTSSTLTTHFKRLWLYTLVVLVKSVHQSFAAFHDLTQKVEFALSDHVCPHNAFVVGVNDVIVGRRAL